MSDRTAAPPARPLAALQALFARSRRPLVLTGAGVSTASGIPDYRDRDGGWKARRPVTYHAFRTSPATRRRYWARSLVGWPRMADARPNAAHEILARLEREGRVHHLLTQNVDGLHQRAGSRRVLDLHGRLDLVECLGCLTALDRRAFQQDLLARNAAFAALPAEAAPDGDAALDHVSFDAFQVPDCPACGGVLKPAVVFFGENVPADRVESSYRLVSEADLLLVVGSSLMVFSGYRFVRAARRYDIPVALVNLGRTRADGEAALKVEAPCAEVLQALA